MPRYDAAKDADLQKALQKTLEKQFFLNQYRKRKFITDKNVLFDESDSEDTKNLVVDVFDCSNMKYDGVCLLYQRVTESVKKIILQHLFFGVDPYKQDIFVYSFQVVKQAIDDLQYTIAYQYFKLFQRDFVPTADDSTQCEMLLESAEIASIMMKLTLISVRYGMFITDLCSWPYEIDIKPDFDEEDVSLCRAFPHYSDFNPTTNPHVLQEDESLHRKRFQEFLKSVKAGKKIGKLEASAAKKALPNIISGSFYSNSALKRCAGLWIWDTCDSLLIEQKVARSEAIRHLLNHPNLKRRDESSLIRELNRVYVVTKKCIEAGEIIPIEDGKGKKNRLVSNLD